MWASLARVLAWCVLDRPIKELTFRLVDLLVSSTVEHNEVGLPVVGKIEVPLCCRERLSLSFANWSTSLSHHLHHALVLLAWQAFEFLYFAVQRRAHISDAG